MTALYYLIGVIVFAVGVAASIGLHEFGHLVPGKLFDVKVSQYFIGFGRTLWSKRRGETEYGLKAVPLGGYVKLVGMLPPGDDPQPADGRKVRTGSTGFFGQLVSDARAAEYEHIGPHDHGRLFYEKPWWQRAIIWGCGVSINLVIAFVLFAITYMGYGVLEPTNTVAKVYECVKVVSADEPVRKCTTQDPRTPAALMGLRPGDRVVSFNGEQAGSYAHLQKLIRANDSGTATLVVDRDGQRLTLHGNTAINVLPSSTPSAKPIKAGYLGISPTQERHRQDVGFVVSTMGEGTWGALKTIGSMPEKVYHVGRAALGLEKRSPDVMSVVGAGRIAGEMASAHESTPAQKLFSILLLLAGLNLFLGLINLVPLPPFDGAGLAASLVDGARRGGARLLRRPMPKPVDFARLLPLSYAMALLIIVVSVVLVIGDIVAPVSIN